MINRLERVREVTRRLNRERLDRRERLVCIRLRRMDYEKLVEHVLR